MSGFDWLARPYRWMEYVSFGPALQRCRQQFVREVCDARTALVLGDGDGRFTARLLQDAPAMRVLAVDGSAGMLRNLNRRCAASASRLKTACAMLPDGLESVTQGQTFDLVATHFFLDCLTTAEVGDLARQVRSRMSADARWIVSDFHIPRDAMRWPAALLVRGLYLGFRVMTGLRTQHLPDHRSALLQEGFVLQQQVLRLRGLLVAEMWALPSAVSQPEI